MLTHKERGLIMPGLTDAVNRVVVSVCRVTFEQRRRILSRDVVRSATLGSLQMILHELHRLLCAYYALKL